MVVEALLDRLAQPSHQRKFATAFNIEYWRASSVPSALLIMTKGGRWMLDCARPSHATPCKCTSNKKRLCMVLNYITYFVHKGTINNILMFFIQLHEQKLVGTGAHNHLPVLD